MHGTVLNITAFLTRVSFHLFALFLFLILLCLCWNGAVPRVYFLAQFLYLDVNADESREMTEKAEDQSFGESLESEGTEDEVYK